MRWLLALLIVPLTDEAVDLIRALDAPAIEDRDAACAKLLALGPRALGSLRHARESAGTDAQARIDGLLSTIVRTEEERIHDARERERLKPTHGLVFWRRVGDGGRVLKAESPSKVTWDYLRIEDEDGRVVRTERCAVCSPRLILVHSALAVRPFVKGTLTWFSEYPIAFHEPKSGDRRRIGDFEIVIDWPEIQVVSLLGVPRAILAETCRDITLFLRTPQDRLEGGWSQGCWHETDHNEGWDGRWCDCDGSLEHPLPTTSYERRVRIPFSSGVSLDQVDSIRLVFRKPIEEPFEFPGPLIEP